MSEYQDRPDRRGYPPEPIRQKAENGVEDLSREELVDHISALEERVERLEKSQERSTYLPRTVFNHFLQRLCQIDVDDYSADPFPQLSEVERVGAMIQRHESVIEENDGPTVDAMKENWVACVKAAQNHENDPQHARMNGYVALFAENIQTATGHTRRHCRTLIETLGDEYEGAKWLAHERNLKEGGSDRRKQLLIDLDVWGDA